MATPLRMTFAAWCRGTRIDLDITQRELADAVGVSRSLIAAYEGGAVVPDLDMVDRIGAVLDVRFELRATPPVILGPRERDMLHARCSGYVDRHLRGEGWSTRREVEIVDGRTHGWIDLLAFDPRTGTLLIIELKTGLDDIGASERQLGWYRRHVGPTTEAIGWSVRAVQSWLLVLATDEVDGVITRQREVLDIAFPGRAAELRRIVAGGVPTGPDRGLALIDPARRKTTWILPSRADGRRTAAPYRSLLDARSRLGIQPARRRAGG